MSREGNTKPARTFAQLVAQAEGVSLRRAPLRLGESSIKLGRNKRASSLRRAHLAWARQSLAQNQDHSLGRQLAQKVWASLRQTRLGESDSPGRDYQFSPWSHLQQMYFQIQAIKQSIPHTKNND